MGPGLGVLGDRRPVDGHAVVGAGVEEAAGRAPSALRAVGTELRWVGTFLGPWLLRRVLGRSSGDGRLAKRPLLLPVAE